MTNLDTRLTRLETDHAAKFNAAAARLLALLSIGELELLAEFGEHDHRAQPALDRLRELATEEERAVLVL